MVALVPFMLNARRGEPHGEQYNDENSNSHGSRYAGSWMFKRKVVDKVWVGVDVDSAPDLMDGWNGPLPPTALEEKLVGTIKKPVNYKLFGMCKQSN
jgi:hypothetical protein